MRPWAVGLSLFATLLSTISYLAWPGEIIKYGPMILASILAYPFIALVVGWFFIPYFMKLNVTSAYEILEARLGLSVRMLGSFFFLAMRLMWMAVIIYATADKVLIPLTGLDASATPWVCAVMGAITVAYTNDTTNGQAYPIRIDYTGGAGLAPYNAVEFVYETRPGDEIRVASRSLEAVREAILAPKFNFGAPRVAAVDLGTDGSLVLQHDAASDGRGLDVARARRRPSITQR